MFFILKVEIKKREHIMSLIEVLGFSLITFSGMSFELSELIMIS